MKLKNFNYDKINLILVLIIFLLSVSFIFSLLNSGRKRKSSSSIKTSLVNPAYKNDIKAFEIRNGEEVLDFYKKGEIWYTGYYTDQGPFFITAKNDKVSDFISSLCSVKNYEKIITKNNKNEFGLSDEDSFIVTYSAGDNLYELRFGDRNFSDTGYYFMSGKNDSIYISDKSFESFLYAGITQWCDPYLLTRNTEKKYTDSDFMNLPVSDFTELRHGGLSYFIPSDNEPYEKILKIDLGDTSFFVLKFYKSSETEHHVQVSYTNPLSQNSLIEYGVKISDWTFRKIFSE